MLARYEPPGTSPGSRSKAQRLGAMRMSLSRTKSIGLALVIATALPAESKAAGAWNIGVGATSCGEWLEARSDPDPIVRSREHFYVSWVQGYLVGLNFANPKEYPDPPDGSAIAPWLDNHCRNHPLDELIQAANDLSLDLLRRSRGLPERG